MKKLNLLKPHRKRVYLNSGKGQEVDYLYIPRKLGMKELKDDVKKGASQFKDLLEFSEKKPSRVVLIECEKEEEGLMAVSYLAGIYNHKDGICKACCDDFEVSFEDSEEEKSLTLEDYRDIEEEQSFDDSESSGYDPTRSTWEESPYRMPIVDLHTLNNYSLVGNSVYEENDLFTMGESRHNSNQPYWLTVKYEPICIRAKQTGYYGWGLCHIDELLTKELKRFESNRHVYVLVVKPQGRTNQNTSDIFNNYLDEDDEIETGTEVICEMVLEYTAGTVEIHCSENERKKYYQVLFENWAESFDVILEKRFPKTLIAEQIVEMRNEDKSALMEKIFKYILSQERQGNVLKKEDFEILRKFRAMGMMAEKKDKEKSLQKMEKNLVGLEDVKRQVYSIVDVMKYNKKRAQLGLGNGGFHNVHLLIGAPGTAKTTIAQMMGNIMKEQNLLSGNRFVSINGADLKGMYVGHSAPKTRRYFEENDIILIDEAYSLTSETDMDSFSQEAIAQLIIELEKHGTDRLVLFAGYGGKNVRESDNKMKQFLNANPGIRSRINSTIFFNSYTPDEMVEIVHRQAVNMNYELTHDADDMIRAHFEERSKASDFGNGREARSLLENITINAAVRTMALTESEQTKKKLQELTFEDVAAAITKQQEDYAQQKGTGSKRCGFQLEEV